MSTSSELKAALLAASLSLGAPQVQAQPTNEGNPHTQELAQTNPQTASEHSKPALSLEEAAKINKATARAKSLGLTNTKISDPLEVNGKTLRIASADNGVALIYDSGLIFAGKLDETNTPVYFGIANNETVPLSPNNKEELAMINILKKASQKYGSKESPFNHALNPEETTYYKAGPESPNNPYYTGVAQFSVGLKNPELTPRLKVDEKTDMYVASGDNGIALITSDLRVMGAMINEQGSLEYFQIKDAKTKEKKPLTDTSSIDLINKYIKAYGKDTFTRAIVAQEVHTPQSTPRATTPRTTAPMAHSTPKIDYQFDGVFPTYKNNTGVGHWICLGDSKLPVPDILPNGKLKIGPHIGDFEGPIKLAATRPPLNTDSKFSTFAQEYQNFHAYEIIYQDLRARAQAGETLGTNEQTFMETHDKFMKDIHLVRVGTETIQLANQVGVIPAEDLIDMAAKQSPVAKREAKDARKALAQYQTARKQQQAGKFDTRGGR